MKKKKKLGQIFLEEDRIWSEFVDSIPVIFFYQYFLQVGIFEELIKFKVFFYFSGKTTLYLFYQEAHGFALSNFLILASLIPKCLYPLIHWQMNSLIHWQKDIF